MSKNTQVSPAPENLILLNKYDKPHVKERFPGATKTVVLPGINQAVVIGALDIAAYDSSGARTMLNIPALRDVALKWAKDAREAAREEGQIDRPTPELPAEELLRLEEEATKARLRNGLLRPTLDELVEVVGGSLDLPDYGLGTDYSYLMAAVAAFSAEKRGEGEAQIARTFPVQVRGTAGEPGGKVLAASE